MEKKRKGKKSLEQYAGHDPAKCAVGDFCTCNCRGCKAMRERVNRYL
jgi:hypothetical protein